MTEKSFTATLGWVESGFGPASTPLELHWNDDGRLPPGFGSLPTGTSCHCWLSPPQSSYWTMPALSAVEAPWTSRALLLLRLISRTWPPAESASLHCWLVPLWSVHWTMEPPLAVEKL